MTREILRRAEASHHQVGSAPLLSFRFVVSSKGCSFDLSKIQTELSFKVLSPDSTYTVP